MNLREKGGVHGKGWKEVREEGNDVYYNFKRILKHQK